MMDVLRHRGPDATGQFVAGPAALGVQRLSIVDVAGGHQPFSNEDGSIVAVQNGELYNHDELRASLRADGHAFRSRCDTEIIPHLYERYGTSFMRHLRGKFGIAVWDERNRRAVITRDRLGIKPLYWAQAGDLVVFASELKSLLASGLIDSALDYEAIDAYLTLGFVPGPSTPLAGVSKLEPGHRLVVDPSGVRVERYWEFPQPSTSRSSASAEDVAAELLEKLEESVVLRLMSDVPLGAMLSGGLDSSLIVALMARNMGSPVKTFAVGFTEAGAGNELADARDVAQRLGADHHELPISLGEQSVDLAGLVWHMDEPLADLSALGFLALSKLAAQHVTVALSGQGADELLGGYRKHRAAALAGAWGRVPGPLAAAALGLARRGPGRFDRALRTLAAPDAAARLLATSGHLDGAARTNLMRGPMAALDGGAARRAILARMGSMPEQPLPAALYLDGQLGLVDDMLHYFDRASMAHSLEVRVPFLDHELVEFCAGIAPSLKIHRLNTKHVLKIAARGLVPDRIIDKPKIGFFNGAVDSWLRSQARGAISDHLLGPDPRYAELLDRKAVEQLVRRHAVEPHNESGDLLLAILMLELWLSSFLPRALAAPEPVREHVRLSA
jgi:asparagine synthase (glutamine-hydrolysing)